MTPTGLVTKWRMTCDAPGTMLASCCLKWDMDASFMLKYVGRVIRDGPHPTRI